MTAIDAYLISASVERPIFFDRDVAGQEAVLITAGGAVVLPTFKMRGRDDGRTPGSDYIIWIFTGAEPDFAGTGFAGGDPTPIGNLIADSAVNLGELG